MSSWKPGASPTNISSACGLPAPNTTCVRPWARRQRVQAATARRMPGDRRRARPGPRSRAVSLGRRPDERSGQRLIAMTRRPPVPRGARLDLVADGPAEQRAADGRSGETPPTLEISTQPLAVSRSSSTCEPTVTTPLTAAASSSIMTRAGAVAQDRDPPLEQALLVLRRVVLEVLGEIAVTAGDGDRLDDRLPAGSFELGELGSGSCSCSARGQLLGPEHNNAVAAAAGAAAAAAAARR